MNHIRPCRSKYLRLEKTIIFHLLKREWFLVIELSETDKPQKAKIRKERKGGYGTEDLLVEDSSLPY